MKATGDNAKAEFLSLQLAELGNWREFIAQFVASLLESGAYSAAEGISDFAWIVDRIFDLVEQPQQIWDLLVPGPARGEINFAILDRSQIEDLARVLNYAQPDEERDYVINEDEAHIVHPMRRLRSAIGCQPVVETVQGIEVYTITNQIIEDGWLVVKCYDAMPSGLPDDMAELFIWDGEFYTNLTLLGGENELVAGDRVRVMEDDLKKVQQEDLSGLLNPYAPGTGRTPN